MTLQVESQGQQLALEHLYQDLAKNRDDWALVIHNRLGHLHRLVAL
jgi:hypothetical protein